MSAGHIDLRKTHADIPGWASIREPCLSVGCGRGESLSETPLVVGVDAYADTVAVAASNGPAVRADAHSLPFDDETFRTVVVSHVLEHVESPLTALKEAYRVLTPGGSVVVEVPWSPRHVEERETHLQGWTPTTLRNILRAAGFIAVEAEGVDSDYWKVVPVRDSVPGVKTANRLLAAALGETFFSVAGTGVK